MSAVQQALLFVWGKHAARASELMANLPGEKATAQPHGLKNHPVWCLGHLSLYHAAIVALARGETIAEPASAPGADLFANGSKPADDPSIYPAAAKVLERFLDGHAEVEAALKSMDPATLDKAPGLERWAKAFGTTAGALLYLVGWHEGHHLAEVADWKKVQGIPLKG